MERYAYMPVLCPVCKVPIVITAKRLQDFLRDDANCYFVCGEDCSKILEAFEPEWMN